MRRYVHTHTAALAVVHMRRPCTHCTTVLPRDTPKLGLSVITYCLTNHSLSVSLSQVGLSVLICVNLFRDSLSPRTHLFVVIILGDKTIFDFGLQLFDFRVASLVLRYKRWQRHFEFERKSVIHGVVLVENKVLLRRSASQGPIPESDRDNN